MPELPPTLTHECKPMKEYASGELAEILATHGSNMESANRCIARHAAIVQSLQGLSDGSD